jgi:hypothetical protein
MASRPRPRIDLRMFPTVLSPLRAAVLLGLSDVQPAIAQFFDFFQRPPAATGETYQRQRTRIPQQGSGYGFGWGDSLWFPKIRSGWSRAVRENHCIIRCDVCDHPLACNVCSQFIQVAAPA